MDLSRLSDGDIQEAIRKMQKGIDIKPGSVEAAELQTSIDRALEELQRRTQKKSDPQPTGKTEQFPPPKTYLKSEESQKDALKYTQEQAQTAKAFYRTASSVNYAPLVAPKPTATIHFAGQQYPGQYTRGELWSDVRQNFKLVLLSATFRRCLGSGDYSELWSLVLFVKLWQGIHEGLKKLEGGKDYTVEDLLIRHWAYGDDVKQAGRALAEYLKQPKPQQ